MSTDAPTSSAPGTSTADAAPTAADAAPTTADEAPIILDAAPTQGLITQRDRSFFISRRRERHKKKKSMKGKLVDDPNHQFGRPRVARNHFSLISLNFIRRIISGNRQRFKYQNLDLDMAYITDRVIAIGYPAKGVEAVFRNKIAHCRSMLYRRHGSHRVKMFNLRNGCMYDPENFENEVVYIDMMDHHPPRLEMMAPFCREAKEWLDENPLNVIAVHCKAGKGRTGLAICAFLSYIKFFDNPRQILDYYSIIRTEDNKGVTIPSQRRYIYYYDHLRKKNLNYLPLRMQLVGVYIERPPKTKSNGTMIRVKVTNDHRAVFMSESLNLDQFKYEDEVDSWKSLNDDNAAGGSNPQYVSKRAYCFMAPEGEIFLEGDVRVDLLSSATAWDCKRGRTKIGHVWFNTFFACGQEDFIYGDKQWPYVEGETSIGRKTEKEGETYLVDQKKKEPKWNIIEPPMLNVHTPEESLKDLYDEFGMPHPRIEISRILHRAHRKGYVVDRYAQQRFKRNGDAYHTEGRIVETLPAKPGGPFQIPIKKGEHVLTFPYNEIDVALKDKNINKGMKIHVVVRCLDGDDTVKFAASEVFTQQTVDTEPKTKETREMSLYGKPDKKEGAIGAEKMDRKAILYAKDGHYRGEAHPNLTDDAFKDSEPAKSDRWCRYYYRQNMNTSFSMYPATAHTCTLTGKSCDLFAGRKYENPTPTSVLNDKDFEDVEVDEEEEKRLEESIKLREEEAAKQEEAAAKKKKGNGASTSSEADSEAPGSPSPPDVEQDKEPAT